MDWPLVQEMLFRGIGGLGLFLLGLHFLSEGIRALAAARVRQLMELAAATRISGLLTGFVITCFMQSGTAVTGVITGFVNSGMVTLKQAISLIMGANIGGVSTTVFIALPIAHLGLPMLGLAALVYRFSGQARLRSAALAVMGLGMLFFGLEQMTAAFQHVRDMPLLVAHVAGFSTDGLLGLLRCILAGALLTALLHSPSVTAGLVMGLGTSGVIEWQTALALVLGAELGAALPLVLTSAGLAAEARRAAFAYLLFNLAGVLVGILIFPLYTAWVALLLGGDPGLSLQQGGYSVYPLVPLAVAAFRGSFNILTTLMLLPWQQLLLRLLRRLFRQQEVEEPLARPRYLLSRALKEPDLAAVLLAKEQNRYRMALPGLLDPVCRPDRITARQFDRLQQSLSTLGQAIESFGQTLCAKDLAPDTAARLMRDMQAQEDCSALAERLHTLASSFDGRELKGQARAQAAQWTEALDALLGEAVEALNSGDGEHLALIREATAEQGPSLERLRQRYLEGSERFSFEERRSLLAVLGQIEGSLWLLSRLCRQSLQPARVAVDEQRARDAEDVVHTASA